MILLIGGTSNYNNKNFSKNNRLSKKIHLNFLK
jgi:hypothetical protein